jgi:helicase
LCPYQRNGINTPASTVIIAEQEFIGEDGRQFTVAQYKNMAGRAGRLGYNEQGKSIILATDYLERQRLFNRYPIIRFITFCFILPTEHSRGA